jgi:hypothetical protein
MHNLGSRAANGVLIASWICTRTMHECASGVYLVNFSIEYWRCHHYGFKMLESSTFFTIQYLHLRFLSVFTQIGQARVTYLVGQDVIFGGQKMLNKYNVFGVSHFFVRTQPSSSMQFITNI